MLQLTRIDPAVKATHSSESWNSLNIQFHDGWWGRYIYLYIGNYLEICLGQENAGIGTISLVRIPSVYYVKGPTALEGRSGAIGYPIFKKKAWLSRIDPSYEPPQHLQDKPYQEFELYLHNNTVAIMLWPHPINLMVKNEQISFGFNREKRLCLIKLTDLTELEMARIVENLSTREAPFTATLNTLNYAHAANKDLNHLQLKDIKTVCATTIIFDPNTPLTISFDTTVSTNDSNIIWSIDGLLELQLDQPTGSLVNISFLQAPSVYLVNQLQLPNSLHDKVGMPLFKTKEWAAGPVPADINHQKQFDIFLTKNTLTIILWPHYAALTVTNGRVTFCFNTNKTLCSITITDFTPDEMNKLAQSLSTKTSIIQAADEVINYNLLHDEQANMLQLKDVGPSTSEQIESDFDRPLSIKFCKELAAPENYIDWRIDRFVEIGLNRTTGAIEQFTLRRNCKIGKPIRLEALECADRQTGLPSFKTLLWLEGIPKKDISPLDEYMILLDNDTVTIEFSPHRITSTVINQRVIFGFNGNQSLCSITITNLTKDEMKLLINSLGNKIKNE